jgi:4'-phosphopantetheinyl transferase
MSLGATDCVTDTRGPPAADAASAWSSPPEPLRLPADEVHVWRIRAGEVAARLPQLERLLSPDERARIAQFRRAEDRASRVIAHGMLRALLAGYLGRAPEALRFGQGPHGKPILAARPSERTIDFNASHSGDIVLLAFSGQGAVGVDVEVVRSDIDLDSLSARVLAPEELALLERADAALRPRLFLRAWTRKEAILKALGTGFSVEPGGFAALTEAPAGAGAPLCRGPAGVRPLRVADLDVGEGFAAALATERPGLELRRFSAPRLDPA